MTKEEAWKEIYLINLTKHYKEVKT